MSEFSSVASSASEFSSAFSEASQPSPEAAAFLSSVQTELEEHRYFEVAAKVRAKMAEDESLVAELLEVGEIRGVLQRVEQVERVRELASSEDTWKLQRASDGIRTFYRHFEASEASDGEGSGGQRSVHSVRIEGEVDAGVLHVLALLHEVDLYHTWMPTYNFLGLRQAKRLDDGDHASPVELLVQIDVAVPWPVSDRKIFLRCTGVDCMGTEGDSEIVVLLETPESEILGDFRVPDDGTVEVEVLAPSGVVLRPQGDGKTFVCVVLNADPHLNIVPEWLVDFAVRNLAFLILVAIRKATELVMQGEEYGRRMRDRENPFYNHLRRRFAETMPEELRHFPDDDEGEVEGR